MGSSTGLAISTSTACCAEGDRPRAGSRTPGRPRALPARGAGGRVDRPPQRDPALLRGRGGRRRLPGHALHRRRRRAHRSSGARARSTPERAADITAQAGDGLDAIHAAGYVHRDVKPANLLLARGGHVYLTDFGVATRRAAPGWRDAHGTLGRHAGLRRARADPRRAVDARADVYALGGVLHFMLTGPGPVSSATRTRRRSTPTSPSRRRTVALRPELPRAARRGGRARDGQGRQRPPSLGRRSRPGGAGGPERRASPGRDERMVATGAAAPGGRGRASARGRGADALSVASAAAAAPRRRRRRLAWIAGAAAGGGRGATAVVLGGGGSPSRDDGVAAARPGSGPTSRTSESVPTAWPWPGGRCG